jgi:hypothetical protein
VLGREDRRVDQHEPAKTRRLERGRLDHRVAAGRVADADDVVEVEPRTSSRRRDRTPASGSRAPCRCGRARVGRRAMTRRLPSARRPDPSSARESRSRARARSGRRRSRVPTRSR